MVAIAITVLLVPPAQANSAPVPEDIVQRILRTIAPTPPTRTPGGRKSSGEVFSKGGYQITPPPSTATPAAETSLAAKPPSK